MARSRSRSILVRGRTGAAVPRRRAGLNGGAYLHCVALLNTFPALEDGDFRRLEGGVPPRPQNV
jgi:hypothetical protein